MTLLEEEEKYCRYLKKQTSSLLASYDGSLPYVRAAIKEHDITKAILLRMNTYYKTQNYVKILLNKRNLTAASDFFVEALVYYFKLVLEAYDSELEVHSERPISQKRGSIRPDMTSQNWPGFPKDDERVGKQLFTLSTVWPSDIDMESIEDIIINPIESIFVDLINK